MNYYPFHLGDYAAHTRHLSLMEDLAYRRMLDLYYTSEQPLPDDPEKVARLIGMRDQMREVSDVLSDFFLKSDTGYINARCDREIVAYKAKADRAKSANKARWEGKSSDPVLKSDADQVPTNNQEPITNKKSSSDSRGSRLPEDWHPTPEDVAFCKTERVDLRPSEVAKRFYDYWIAQPGAKGRKVNWSSTWRNWVRDERPGKEPVPQKKDWE